MENQCYCKYDIGTAPWNSLSKSEYLAVAQMLYGMASPFAGEGRTPEVKIEVAYCTSDTAPDTTFESIDEFSSFFSPSVNFKYLVIRVFSRALSLTARFGAPYADHSVILSSESMTYPELEDMALSLKSYLVDLFKSHEPPAPAPEASREQTGVRAAHLSSSREHTISRGEKHNEDKPEKAHSKESPGNQNKNSLLRRAALFLAEFFGRLLKGLLSVL